jgi:hypothetical protein
MVNERTILRSLSPFECILFRHLKGFKEISIETMWASLLPLMRKPPAAAFTRKEMQQRIGAIISNINHKIGYYDLQIRPGAARGTYKIYRVIDRPAQK